MALTWTLNSVDISGQVRYRQWALTECAERGVVGASTIIVDDATGSYTPPAQKAIIVEESAAGTSRMFTGYVAERSVKRSTMAPGQRQWSVTVEDVNVLLDDRIITDAMGGKRTSTETDYERITWLLGTAAAGPISAGSVPNTHTVTMDKVDYRGKTLRDVLEDCAQKSGKTFFVYRHASGPLLYYNLPNASVASLDSSLRISDDESDIDSTTTFGPSSASLSLDPTRVYSKVRIRYKGGSATAENPTTASTFRTRETYKRYMRVKTAARAVEQAEKWLEQADDETRKISCSIMVGAAQVNDLRAGMRCEIKLSRFGLNSFVWWRVTRRTVRQISDTQYELELQFAEKMRATKFFEGPDISVDEEASNGSEDTATAVIDESGLTITGGSISVTNGSGTVIIDGTSDFFSIVASGTLTIPDTYIKGQTYQSVSVVTGLEYDPSSLFFVRVPSSDGKGNWSQPTPTMELSASGTILRMVSGRARHVTGTTGTSARTQVQVMRFTTASREGPVTVRYYVLQKTAI